MPVWAHYISQQFYSEHTKPIPQVGYFGTEKSRANKRGISLQVQRAHTASLFRVETRPTRQLNSHVLFTQTR